MARRETGVFRALWPIERRAWFDALWRAAPPAFGPSSSLKFLWRKIACNPSMDRESHGARAPLASV